MPMRGASVIAISFTLASVARCQTSYEGAREVVSRFCAMDAAAVRLDGRVSRPLWDLAVGDDDPPDGPIGLIAGYRIVQSKTSGNVATVVVEYQLLGTVEDGPLSFHPSKQRERAVFYLIVESGGWKIDVSKLKTPPHILPASLVRYFQGLLTDTPVKDASRRKNISEMIEQLRRIEARAKLAH